MSIVFPRLINYITFKEEVLEKVILDFMIYLRWYIPASKSSKSQTVYVVHDQYPSLQDKYNVVQ